LGILFSSILCTCPKQRNLCNLIVSVIATLLYFQYRPPRGMRSGRKWGSNWGCYYLLFEKKTVKRLSHCQVFAQSPLGRRPSDKYPINTSHRSDLWKNVSLVVLLGSNGNSYTVATQSDVCVYIHIHTHTYTYLTAHTHTHTHTHIFTI
jgi:hypothetical protein